MVKMTLSRIALLAAYPMWRLAGTAALAIVGLGLGVFQPAEVIGGGVGG